MSASTHSQHWSSDRLCNLLESTIDYRGSSVPKAESGIPLITARNVRSGTLDFSVQEFVDERAYAEWTTRGLPRPGDILFTTEAPLGNVATFPSQGRFAIGQRVVALRPKADVLDPSYLLQFLLSPTGQKRIDLYSTGSTAKGISSERLHQLVVDYPCLSVQRKTASLLSAWDAAIKHSDLLIVAKERQYAGLIRRLISGPARSATWKPVPLNQVADRIHRQSDGGDYPLLTISSSSGFVRQEDRYSRYMAGESAKTYTLLRQGEFSYNKGNSKRYQFGCVFQLNGYAAALVPSVYVSFALHDSVCAAYMRHLFIADYLKPQLRALVKTGVRNNGLLNISPDEFMSVRVPLPPLAEQVRVANFLDSIRDEIRLLQRKLQEFQAQKRGLMNKLLGGKWQLERAGLSSPVTSTANRR